MNDKRVLLTCFLISIITISILFMGWLAYVKPAIDKIANDFATTVVNK